MGKFLGFDVGGSKIGWGVVNEKGELGETGVLSTPTEAEPFVAKLVEIAKANKVSGIGIGMPGTISADRRSTVFCTNVPALSELPLAELIEQEVNVPVVLDNDARCALIGEVWLGAAKDLENAVLVTIGTGIGGAAMQKGRVLPNPTDVSQEISRIMVDPTDVFPTNSGNGTVEAFLGGHNLEERFQIDMKQEAKDVRKDNPEAKEVWHAISFYFVHCLRAIHAEYHCPTIIIGGIGSNDLEYYLQDEPPCTVVPAVLREKAAIFGAARLAMDKKDEVAEDPK